MLLLLPLALFVATKHVAAQPAAAWNFHSLQSILTSIDDRLRGLDALYSVRLAPRWEMSLDQLGRRLESTETKLGRIEALLELRLDKLAEVINGRQMKEDFSKDQLNHKIESLYERMNYRMSYMETRMELGSAKMNTKIETSTSEIQSSIESLSKGVGRITDKQTAMGSNLDHMEEAMNEHTSTSSEKITELSERIQELESEVLEVATGVDEIKSQMKDVEEKSDQIIAQTNTSLESMQHVLTQYQHQLENITRIGKINDFTNVQMKLQKIEEILGQDFDTEASSMEVQTQLQQLSDGMQQLQETVENLNSSFALDCTRCSKNPQNDGISRNSNTCLKHDFNDHVKNLTNVISDSMKNNQEKLMAGFNSESRNFGNKVTNMYNDLWKRSQNLEVLVKEILIISNSTRYEIQESIHSLMQTEHNFGPPTDVSIELSLDALAGLIQKKLTDLSQRLDSSFQMITLAQNLFLESCHRIQLGEPQMEARLSLVLEKLLDIITNRSTTTDKHVEVFQEILKSHNEHVIQNIKNLSTLVSRDNQLNTTSLMNDTAYATSLLNLQEKILDHWREKGEEILSTLAKVENKVSYLTERGGQECTTSREIADEVMARLQQEFLYPSMEPTNSSMAGVHPNNIAAVIHNIGDNRTKPTLTIISSKISDAPYASPGLDQIMDVHDNSDKSPFDEETFIINSSTDVDSLNNTMALPEQLQHAQLESNLSEKHFELHSRVSLPASSAAHTKPQDIHKQSEAHLLGHVSTKEESSNERNTQIIFHVSNGTQNAYLQPMKSGTSNDNNAQSSTTKDETRDIDTRILQSEVETTNHKNPTKTSNNMDTVIPLPRPNPADVESELKTVPPVLHNEFHNAEKANLPSVSFVNNISVSQSATINNTSHISSKSFENTTDIRNNTLLINRLLEKETDRKDPEAHQANIDAILDSLLEVFPNSSINNTFQTLWKRLQVMNNNKDTPATNHEEDTLTDDDIETDTSENDSQHLHNTKTSVSPPNLAEVPDSEEIENTNISPKQLNNESEHMQQYISKLEALAAELGHNRNSMTPQEDNFEDVNETLAAIFNKQT